MASGRFIQEQFKGRKEKRLPIAIVVQLAQVEDGLSPRGLELTFTDNISAHGACVVSSRPWEPGELVDLTSLKDQITLCGKVMHCQKRNHNLYAIGVQFDKHAVTWPTFRTYTGV